MQSDPDLETKFAKFGEAVQLTDGAEIQGYASYFGAVDQGGDIVAPGAYAASLAAHKAAGRSVKMLWQHDPAFPIGIWDEVREDAKGLFVKGRILDSTQKGAEAIALIEAGAIDGLSIGYKTKKARRGEAGARILEDVELWEVSLVTFPMLPTARVGAKAGSLPQSSDLRDLAAALRAATCELARP